MDHEYRQWHTYLTTAASIEDKRQYLGAFIDGDLDV